MTYELGLSSATIEALKLAGGFSVEKLQQFFPLAVKQAYIYGWSSLAGVIVFLACFIVSIYLMVKFTKELFDNDREPVSAALVLFCIFSGVILIISGCFFFDDGIANLLNPEYMAIKSMIRMFK